jgi:hypothetical protein
MSERQPRTGKSRRVGNGVPADALSVTWALLRPRDLFLPQFRLFNLTPRGGKAARLVSEEAFTGAGRAQAERPSDPADPRAGIKEMSLELPYRLVLQVDPDFNVDPPVLPPMWRTIGGCVTSGLASKSTPCSAMRAVRRRVPRINLYTVSERSSHNVHDSRLRPSRCQVVVVMQLQRDKRPSKAGAVSRCGGPRSSPASQRATFPPRGHTRWFALPRC